MRKLGALVVIAAALVGCHHRAGSHVTGGVLGRVVIYRNGVAFYERNATMVDGRVTVRVPRERVDDFLKSMTVVDKATGKPIGVSIPRQQDGGDTYLTMALESSDRTNANVMLTYVTEAPAWKPSYRIVVGKNGKLMLEAWAVVDNTTSEDWNHVLVGVGASSALAFRYDLWSVHTVDRDLLQGEEKFAIAPPTGVSPYADNNIAGEELASLSGNDVRATPQPAPAAQPARELANGSRALVTETTGALQGSVSDAASGQPSVGVTVVAASPVLQSEQVAITDENGQYMIGDLPPGQYQLSFYYNDTVLQRTGVVVAANKATPVFQKVDPAKSGGEVIRVAGTAPRVDPTSTAQGVTIDKNYVKNIPVPGRTFEAVMGSAAGSSSDGLGVSLNGTSSRENQYYVDGVNTTGLDNGKRVKTKKGKAGFDGYDVAQGGKPRGAETAKPAVAPAAPNPMDERLKAIVAKVQKDKRDVVVEVHGAPGSEHQATARGTAIKNKLVDQGIPAPKIHIVSRIAAGESDNVRVLAIAPNANPERATPPPAQRISPGDTPVGESHFIADKPMTVRSGSSAMVAMVHDETTGGVVYLYDPISERGHKRFAFKAVRLDNPTDDTLESGPVTVYGDGKFIGEGITEPVPPHAAAVIPFALDKQIVVERDADEQDSIAKLVTAQRGIVTAEVQHRRDAHFTVTSRLTVPTTVYLRHRLESGWALLEHPTDITKVGDSHLFAVELRPGETKRVTISEATPVERSFNLASDEGIKMMQVYIEDPKASAPLKQQIEAMLGTYRSAIDLVDKIDTLREQMAEYRARSAELHAQVLSLKAVRTGGDLMATLKAKLAEMSERTQKATIEVVEAQEKLMLTRVKFQNQLADLHLTDVTKRELSKR